MATIWSPLGGVATSMCVLGVITALGRSRAGQRTPQSLPEISGLTPLGVGLKTLLPSLGVLPPSLPSSSDCPSIQGGVLVTANVCVGLGG